MRSWGYPVLVAILAAVFTTSSLHAQSTRTTPDHSGDYLALVLFGSYGEVSDVTASSGSIDVRNSADGTGGVGLVLGYNWAKKGLPIRSEIEINNRFRFDYDARISGRAATFDNAGYEVNLLTQVLFANAYYDYQISDRWALYLGGGIGAAHHMLDVDRVELDGFARTTRDDSTVSFAWNVAIGAVWQIADNWDLDFRYRYMDLGGFETGPHNDTTNTVIETDNYTSHDFLLGIVYRF